MTAAGPHPAKASVRTGWRGLVLLAASGLALLAPVCWAQAPGKPPAPAASEAPAAKPVDIAAIRAQAEAGNSEAQIAMGVAYRSGQAGVAKDPKAARAWFEKAAAQKHPAALRMLGDMYAAGEGGRKDSKKALENWQGAEAAGDPFAPIKVADQLFGEISGGKPPGPGKFRIAPGTPVSRMDDIAAWYREAETRDPRPEVKQRAQLAIQVLTQIKAGLKKAGHPN